MRRGVAVLLAAALLWALLWALNVSRRTPADEERDSRVFQAEGYNETVDLFIRHQWLEFEQGRRRIGLSPKLPEDSAAVEFFRKSYLEQDVAAWNNGDTSVFRIENGRIWGIDPNRHNILLPFSDLRQWHGELTYRPEDLHRGELIGRSNHIQLVGPIKNVIMHGNEDGPETTVSHHRSSSRVTPVEAEVINLFSDNPYRLLGKAHLIGDAILFNHRAAESGVEISISGEVVYRGNKSRLDSGDLLKLQWTPPGKPRRYALLWAGITGDAPVLSSFRSINGRWRRTPDEVEPRFAADVLRSVNYAFQRRDRDGSLEIPKALGLDSLDLALTLDQTLQVEVQQLLRDYCNRLRDRHDPPFRGAVTVMDTLTGEILAMASYPETQDLKGWTQSTDSRERLLRNHNLARLPIGSVAKVIFAAGILQRAPVLAQLKIPGNEGGKVEQILGITLSSPLKDHPVWGGPDERIDFEEFIEHSSNLYAVSLLTLANAVDETGALLPPEGERLGESQRFWIGSRYYTQRPGFRSLSLKPDPENPEQVVSRTIVTLEHEPHVLALRELFDLDTTVKRPTEEDVPRRAPGTGDDVVDTTLWLPLLSRLYGDEIPRFHPFYGVSPERENLAYNLIDNYRTEYLSGILGGASSVWTNTKVAESFARLVTGLKVRQTLVRRIDFGFGEEPLEPTPETKDLEPLGLDSGIRALLLRSMTKVTGPEGTASALRGTVRDLDKRLRKEHDNARLAFFSKTGSPTNVKFVPNGTAQTLNALISEGALHLGTDGLMRYRDAGPIDSALEVGGTNPVLAALDQHPGDLSILRRHGASKRLVLWIGDTYNNSDEDVRQQLFERKGTVLTVTKRFRKELTSIGGAYVFTMGHYGTSGTPGDVLPQRSLTVAINIESQGNGPTVAVPLAKLLIDGVVGEALIKGW